MDILAAVIAELNRLFPHVYWSWRHDGYMHARRDGATLHISICDNIINISGTVSREGDSFDDGTDIEILQEHFDIVSEHFLDDIVTIVGTWFGMTS